MSLCWFLLEELGVDVFFLLLSFSFTVKASQKKKKKISLLSLSDAQNFHRDECHEVTLNVSCVALWLSARM